MSNKNNQTVMIDRDLMADRARELMVLNAIAAAVAESLEPQPLLVSALDHVLDLMELDAGAIYTLGDDKHLHVMVGRGINPEVQQRFAQLPTNNSFIGRMVAERKTLLIEDVRHNPELAALADENDLHALLGLPLFARGEVAGVLVVLRTSIAAFSIRETKLLEAIADHIALALDNARLFAAEQQRRKQAEALRKGAVALTEALGPDAVLHRIVEQASELMEAPMCAIYEFEGSAGQLAVRSTWGEMFGQSPLNAIIGEHVASAAIKAHHAVSVHDITNITSQQRLGLTEILASRSDGSLPFFSVLAAPLLIKGRAYGGIVVYYETKRSFSAGEIQLIDIFADQAAIALEHARLFDQSRQLAALQERQRIARDLHDSVSQTLFSLTLAAQAARTTLETNAAAATTALETVQELASGALAEMRALIFELRPGALREAGLAAAIERFVGGFKSRTGLVVKLELDHRRLPYTIEEALYRITGEALANIGKHACATNVAVKLRRIENIVELVVHDDGIGFDPAQPIIGDHMGQRTMQERAAALGGACRVQSSSGQGATVTVTIPITSEHNELDMEIH